MKAQELRIGNWVQAPLGEFMQVTQIGHLDNPYYIMAEIPENKGFCTNLFKPIPLTPEILEKCGFKKMHEANKHFAINDPNGYAGKYKISIFQTLNNQWQIAFSDEVSSYKDYIPTTKISYLHQLQNLIYALTGEELEFKP